MDITGSDVAAALRGQRAMSKMTVADAVEEASAICGSSPRTLTRRLDTGVGLTIDEASAFATVLGVKASHVYKLARLHHEAFAEAVAS